MTLEQRLGQLLAVGYDGLEPPPWLIDWIKLGRVGGIILFGDNLDQPRQVAELTATLQALAPVPLLFYIDQEGGIVSRLREPATVVPGAMALAATGDPARAQQAAGLLATEMRALGLHVNLAPVLDIQSNPTKRVLGIRCYGDTPETVREFGLAAIRGYQANGVLATAKHFPGLGESDLDSHHDLPAIPHPKARLHQVELLPFKAAIEAGVDLIMTSHARFPAYDPERPATLSPAILTGLLRQTLGFKGLIATDALEMNALADRYPPEERAVLALEAGVDLLMPAHGAELQQRVFWGLLEAVRAGRISEERLEASLARVMAAKARLSATAVPPLTVVGCAEHRATAQRLADESITLVKDAGLLPLRLSQSQTLGVIDFSLPRFSLVEEARQATALLAAEIGRRWPQSWVKSFSARLSDEDSPAVLAAAQEADTLLVITRNADDWAGQARCVQALLAMRKPIVIAAVRNPFDLKVWPEAGTYLCTYGDATVQLRALVRVLFGAVVARGLLPVSLDI
ncbi:MAG TPA: glycoside hydrolase family 3 N-terminal domain-containing protein [Anaerolineae bacterium]|nr:glycoside hydrolase family 3 N-terminal domain-containing protein [Anaerolineae bacterium]